MDIGGLKGIARKFVSKGHKNNVISWLRLLFVLCIVGYHFAPAHLRLGFSVFVLGQVFVTFFFVLSGFLLKVSDWGEWSGAGKFLAGKVRALMPLYLTSILICAGIDAAAGTLRPAAIAADVLLVQAWLPGLQLAMNGPAWFMSALFACFVCYPFVRPLRPPALLAVASGYWLLVQIAGGWLSAGEQLGEFSYWQYFPPFHLASFLLGMAVGSVCGEISAPDSRRFLYCCFATIAAVSILCAFHTLQPMLVWDLLQISLSAPVFALVVVCAVLFPWCAIGGGASLAAEWAGVVSYPIYLLQMPMFQVYYQFALKPEGGSMTSPLFLLYAVVLFAAAGLWIALCRVFPVGRA